TSTPSSSPLQAFARGRGRGLLRRSSKGRLLRNSGRYGGAIWTRVRRGASRRVRWSVVGRREPVRVVRCADPPTRHTAVPSRRGSRVGNPVASQARASHVHGRGPGI